MCRAGASDAPPDDSPEEASPACKLDFCASSPNQLKVSIQVLRDHEGKPGSGSRAIYTYQDPSEWAPKGFLLDASTGMYWNIKAGYSYDPQTELFFNCVTEKHYYFNKRENCLVERPSGPFARWVMGQENSFVMAILELDSLLYQQSPLLRWLQTKADDRQTARSKLQSQSSSKEDITEIKFIHQEELENLKRIHQLQLEQAVASVREEHEDQMAFRLQQLTAEFEMKERHYQEQIDILQQGLTNSRTARDNAALLTMQRKEQEWTQKLQAYEQWDREHQEKLQALHKGTADTAIALQLQQHRHQQELSQLQQKGEGQQQVLREKHEKQVMEMQQQIQQLEKKLQQAEESTQAQVAAVEARATAMLLTKAKVLHHTSEAGPASVPHKLSPAASAWFAPPPLGSSRTLHRPGGGFKSAAAANSPSTSPEKPGPSNGASSVPGSQTTLHTADEELD